MRWLRVEAPIRPQWASLVQIQRVEVETGQGLQERLGRRYTRPCRLWWRRQGEGTRCFESKKLPEGRYRVRLLREQGRRATDHRMVVGLEVVVGCLNKPSRHVTNRPMERREAVPGSLCRRRVRGDELCSGRILARVPCHTVGSGQRSGERRPGLAEAVLCAGDVPCLCLHQLGVDPDPAQADHIRTLVLLELRKLRCARAIALCSRASSA
jgi:hypothetical protein